MATTYSTYVDGEELSVTIHTDGRVQIGERVLDVDLQEVLEGEIYSMLIGGQSHEVYASLEDGTWRILLDGERYEATVEDERTKRLKGLGGANARHVGDLQIKAPMPGLVVKIPVAVGDHVTSGQPLLILEAMKMENELRSPRAGVVKEIRVAPRQAVELQQVLLLLGDEE